MRSLRFMVLSFLLVFCTIPCGLSAKTSLDVPGELGKWRGWVLEGHEQELCPCYHNQSDPTICAWPARLFFDFTAREGIFRQKWTLFAESFVPLPGGQTVWPGDVTADGTPRPVVVSNGSPAIRLEAGTHEIRGRFTWKEMPETIRIPEICGLVSLTVDRIVKDQVYIDRDNHLYVRKSDGKGQTVDSLDTRIFRLIDDQIPMMLTTRLKMNVSGKARDVRMEHILPKGFIILSIRSELPVKINPDGNLTVRVRAGTWEMDVAARSLQSVAQIPLSPAPFGDEIWCFSARNHLRMVRTGGAVSVDPGQTDLPEEWKHYSAFVVRQGDVLSFEEIKRGNPDPPPNVLNLNRVLWLDFSGNGWTAKDEIKGSRTRESVFTMQLPFELGRATVDGQDRLITAHGKEKLAGIEVLNQTVDIAAESRIEENVRIIPGSGWNTDFQTVKAVVNLPVGYRLMAVSGPDGATGTWLGRWTLLDFFILVMIAVVVFKLWGKGAGCLSLVTLGICFHEPGAPAFIWIFILSAAALLRVLPDNRFRRLTTIAYAVFAIILIGMSVMFMAHQVRIAAFPQLDPHAGHLPGQWMETRSEKSVMPQAVRDMAQIAPKAPVPAKEAVSATRKALYGQSDESYFVSGTMKDSLQWLDPDALNQTGPGLPLWQWKTHHLSWNGPVNSSETIRFWLLPPLLTSVLGFLRVILLAAMILVVLDARSLLKRTRARYFSAGTVWFLACAVLLISRPAMAQGFPPQQLLDEYRQHLLEKPACLPHCADIPLMTIMARDDRIGFEYDVHADIRTAVPLPQVGGGIVPKTVLVDQVPVEGLFKDLNNIRYVLIEEGIHRIRVETMVRDLDETNVFFPLLPRKASVDAEDWRIQGIDSDGGIQSGIRLIRESLESDIEQSATAGTKNRVDDFFILEKNITLGLDWRIHHELKRVSDIGTSAVVQIPLLKGESILSGGMDSRDGMVLVTMDADQTSRTWESALEKSDGIDFTAARSREYIEKWYLTPGPIWHVEPEGIPLIRSTDESGEYTLQWQPWPGETLKINVSRPEAVKGRILTIDRCRITVRPGKRLSHAAMDLRIRSSKGGPYALTIPRNAVLQKVMISDRELPVSLHEGTLTLPLEPGLQNVSLEWIQSVDRFTILSMPEVSLNQAAVNVDARMILPHGRWVLWTSGPRLGPAVLFWSHLIVIAVAAVILGRAKTLPISRAAWFLLGLGLTQVPIWVSLAVVLWFFALKWRGMDRLPENAWMFNLMQIGLAGMTVLSLGGLFAAVSGGLLGIPDMQITGNGSDGTSLFWTMDRISGNMPPIRVVSLPMAVFKLLMLVWSLWLTFSLVKWLKWGWSLFSNGGLWRKTPRLIRRSNRKTPPSPGS